MLACSNLLIKADMRRFTYQLLQGFDFVHMARHHGVRVQVGPLLIGYQLALLLRPQYPAQLLLLVCNELHLLVVT